MLSKITLKKIGGTFKLRLMLLCLFSLQLIIVNAQTTITTPYSFTSANAHITFNVKNNNTTPVVITGIGSVLNLAGGNADVSAYFKPGAISGAPGAISVANGWNSFGSATVPANGLGTIQPFLTATSLTIPAGATYGIAVNAFPAGTTTGGALGYNNPAGDPSGSNIVSSICGVDFITGTNIGFAGAGVPNAPASTVRRFVGTITFLNSPCTGTPTPGNTISSVTNVCPGVNFNLSLQNCVNNTGLTFKWQKSAALTGPYTDIAGATVSTLTTTQSVPTYYRSVVTCGGNSATSTPLLVATTITSLCYCAADALNPFGEKIENVKFGTINNTSTSSAGYESFISLSPTASFVAGSTNTITITGDANTYSADQVIVWIDYNHNGSFTDAGEKVYTSAISAGPYTSAIIIPVTATVGITGMRVRMHDTSDGPNATSCGRSDWGQVEDYYIDITACVPVTVSAQPANSTISCGSDASFTLSASGTSITYQWQQRNDATSPWNNLANGGVYSGVTTNTLKLTTAPVSMNGYQYRVIYNGACSGTDFSNVATLTVNTLVAVINPPSAIICNGGLQQLTISNIDAPALAQFTSGTINLAIPDKIGPPVSTAAVADAGVNNTIAVTIPGGSVIASMNVTLNINHTWIGDLVVVLKAPNGKILNLLYHKSGTGATSGGTNLTNTVISSTGTASISTGTAPFTGTFKADASIGAGTLGDAQGSGPTGFQPDVTTFSGLYSTPSGNWTIAVADPNGWDGDKGTLVSWALGFSYGAPSTGVFTGTAGTLFTNAAGTILYAGTAINTVYVKPAATSNYTVVVTNSACVSGVTTIPVTVNNPITGTSTVANKSVCVAGNTSFTATPPTTGNTIFHQWKVSTDAGATYTNVSNGGVYSGATTATLNITGATASMNGYRYKDSLYVNVCNSFVNTNAATLTVNATPVVTLSANALSEIYPGQTTTLSVAVSPNAAATYTWFKNGVIVPGASASTLVVDVDALGVYKVSVVDVNGCTATSLNKEIKSAANDKLFIYPNPSTGQFQVRYFSEFGNSIYPRFVNIYDSKGARVFTKSYSINTPYTRLDVNIKNYSKGIYQVELTDFDGKRIKTGRVLIL